MSPLPPDTTLGVVGWGCQTPHVSHFPHILPQVGSIRKKDVRLISASFSRHLHFCVAPAESSQERASIMLLRTHHGICSFNSLSSAESSFLRRDADSFRQQLARCLFQSRCGCFLFGLQLSVLECHVFVSGYNIIYPYTWHV